MTTVVPEAIPRPKAYAPPFVLAILYWHESWRKDARPERRVDARLAPGRGGRGSPRPRVRTLNFLLLALLNPTDETRFSAYLPRLAGFLVILIAIVDRNRR